jgi:hypothetical protein
VGPTLYASNGFTINVDGHLINMGLGNIGAGSITGSSLTSQSNLTLGNNARIYSSLGYVMLDPYNGNAYCQGHFRPDGDNTYLLGSSGARWSQVWAANGTIQTSFLSEKNVTEWKKDEWCLKNLPRVIEYTWKKVVDKRIHLGVVGDDLPLVATPGDKKNIETMGVIALCVGAIRELREEVKKLKEIIQLDAIDNSR